ncbi:MAG: FtsB family cell division protein [Patescibacteria group bacterium]
MGTASRPNGVTGRPESGGRQKRRKWRFRPIGLVGIFLAVVVLINLYVLADNIYRLVKQIPEKAALERRLGEVRKANEALQRQRDWMASPEFVRRQARDLGYIAPGEEALVNAEPVSPAADGAVKRRKDKPSDPY